MTNLVKAIADEFLYEWLLNESWDYLPSYALEQIDMEDIPAVEQLFAELKGWA